MIIKYFSLIILFFCINLFAKNKPSQNLDELLKKVLAERSLQFKELRQREKLFSLKKSQQKKYVHIAQRELLVLEKKTKVLTVQFENQEKTLSKIEERLNFSIGNLGELFGVVRQVSGDLNSQLNNSVTSANILNRDIFLHKISNSKNLPNIAELRKLWFELQQEMTESAKVVSFKAKVVLYNGEKVEKNITRVGSFNLVSEGKYFVYNSQTKLITELSRQPSYRILSLVEDFTHSDNETEEFAVDPSRGAILSAIVQSPNFLFFLSQGGAVGYIIIVLLFVGLILSMERFLLLRKEEDELKKQILEDGDFSSGILGRIVSIFNQYKDKDLDTLELKIEEVLIAYKAKLERGISSLKVMAAVAPLLGLLGTVTGMIATFQAITMFGTGDTKLMAGGISQALVTTVLGLVCAIPLLLIYNFIHSKYKNIVLILEEQSLGIMAEREQNK